MEKDNNNINNGSKSRHIPVQILCDPTQSKYMSRFRKSPPFYGNLQKKCRDPKPRRVLCASLLNRNAL